ncbi:MAG: acVLRF1 family peptidyl-tRNA hydrolase [Nocardioidaceae bacterium]
MDDSAETPAQWRVVDVPADRLPGWVTRFERRHGSLTWDATEESGLRFNAPDGAVAQVRFAFAGAVVTDWASLDARLAEPSQFGLVLVRRGGFAVGWVRVDELVASRVGTRYVQGTTKAGGWSQQRYARRRANQADALAQAAGGAVHDVIGAHLGSGRWPLVGGGDRAMVEQALDASAVPGAPGRLAGRWLPVHDPRKAVLGAAVRQARSARVSLNELA